MTNEKKSDQLAKEIYRIFLESTAYDAGYTCAMEMAEWKDKYYEPLVNECSGIICDQMDDDWCSQHCNSFTSADCVRKWLDLKNKKLSKNGK